MKVKDQVYETKWGYVAYSYEDYKKLKQLHKAYQEEVRKAVRWGRWVRKAPHNRLIRKTVRNEKGQKIGVEVLGPQPEPEFNEYFCKKMVNTDRHNLHSLQKWGNTWVQTDHCVSIEHDIVVEYYNARKPKPRPEYVAKPYWTSEQIDKMLKEVS